MAIIDEFIGRIDRCLSTPDIEEAGDLVEEIVATFIGPDSDIKHLVIFDLPGPVLAVRRRSGPFARPCFGAPADPGAAPGHGSAYAGDAAGSTGQPARDHISTLASANSTVSALAFLAIPR